MQIEVAYEDGRTQRIISHSDWKTSTGPILASEIYHGEIYDAQLERTGWTTATYDDHDWANVELVARNKTALIAPAGPPVRRIEELRPDPDL